MSKDPVAWLLGDKGNGECWATPDEAEVNNQDLNCVDVTPLYTDWQLAEARNDANKLLLKQRDEARRAAPDGHRVGPEEEPGLMHPDDVKAMIFVALAGGFALGFGFGLIIMEVRFC